MHTWKRKISIRMIITQKHNLRPIKIKGNHLSEFESIIRENIEKSKAKGFTWEETEKRLQGIIDFIIPVFRTNTLRLEDEEIKEKVNFEEYNEIWEKIKKEEKEKILQ